MLFSKKLLGVLMLLPIFIHCEENRESKLEYPTENNPAPNEESSDTAIETSQNMTYLALGDSYTIGESVEEKDRFPVQLANVMNNAGFQVSPPKIIAKTGWTTDELDRGIEDAKIEGQFDLVTLLIGVNNQYRGRSLEEFRIQFAALLQRAVSFAGGDPKKVIVVSIPDWGVSPFAQTRDTVQIAKEIDAFNAVKKEETQKQNVLFVNITEISRSGKGNPEYFAKDGLHFSGLMHQLWVNEIAKQAFNIQ